MKLFLRYLLTLCALLLSTHHPALAKQGLGQPSHASAVSHAKALFTNIGCQSSSAPNVAQASPKTAQGYKVVLTDIEEEDYEFLSFKKYLESNGFVAALFQVLTLA